MELNTAKGLSQELTEQVATIAKTLEAMTTIVAQACSTAHIANPELVRCRQLTTSAAVHARKAEELMRKFQLPPSPEPLTE